MATPKALVLRAAGTNCDRETEHALQQAGFQAERVHVFRLMERPATLGEYQFLVIPGGFSYGDDVAAGKILANQMLHRLADALNEFIAAGKLVLDALRPDRRHPSHFILEESLDAVRRIGPARTLLTGMTHNFDHDSTNAELAKLRDSEGLDVQMAYDGQRVPVEF